MSLRGGWHGPAEKGIAETLPFAGFVEVFLFSTYIPVVRGFAVSGGTPGLLWKLTVFRGHTYDALQLPPERQN